MAGGRGMNKYQTLAANTILMSIGTVGSKLLVFLMVRFYTGYLTPAEYGTADLITQTANLLIPLVSLDITDAVFRFAADRRSGRAGGLLRGTAGDHPGLGGNAAGDRPFTGVPGGAGLWIPAGLLRHRLLLSRSLCPLRPDQGGHGPVCRPRTVQHGPVHRPERALPGGVPVGHPGLCPVHHGGEPGHNAGADPKSAAVAICTACP